MKAVMTVLQFRITVLHFVLFSNNVYQNTIYNQLDWIMQCFTSPPTQYRLYGRRFLQVKRPNQQYQSTEGKATKENTKKTQNSHMHTHTK